MSCNQNHSLALYQSLHEGAVNMLFSNYLFLYFYFHYCVMLPVWYSMKSLTQRPCGVLDSVKGVKLGVGGGKKSIYRK